MAEVLFTFPQDEIHDLLSRCAASPATEESLTGTSIPAELRSATFMEAVLAQKTPTETLANGVLAAMGRFPGGYIDGSIGLTEAALAVGRAVDPNALPSTFYTQPVLQNGKPSEPGKIFPYWGYYPHHQAHGRVALVAWTPVNITFISYAGEELEAEWYKLAVLGAHDGKGVRGGSTLFSPDMLNLLNAYKGPARTTKKLAAGDVFLVHSGMPFFLHPASKQQQTFLVQTVISAPPIDPAIWKTALEAGGRWVSGKDFPVHYFTNMLKINKEEGAMQNVKPAFVVQKKQQRAQPAAASSAAPAAASSSLIHQHDILLARIAKLPLRGWDKSKETTAAHYRENTPNKTPGFKKCLDTLAGAVEAAESTAAKVPVVLEALSKLRTAMSAIELLEDMKFEKRSYDALDNKIAKIETYQGNIVTRAEEVEEYTEACKALAAKAKERKESLVNKKPKTSVKRVAATPQQLDIEDELDVIERGDFDEMILEGNELGKYFYAANVALDKYTPMVTAMKDNRVDVLVAHFRQVLGDGFKYAKERSKEGGIVEYNVATIGAYMKALDSIWTKQSQAPAPGANEAERVIQASNGEQIVLGNGTKKRCSGEDGCGEIKPEYADGKCASCFKECLKDRISQLDDYESELRKAARREEAEDSPLKQDYNKYLGSVKRIKKAYSSFKTNKNALPKLIDEIIQAEDIFRIHFPDHESGGSDNSEDEFQDEEEEEEDDGAVKPMDEDEDEDDDDDDDDEIRYATSKSDSPARGGGGKRIRVESTLAHRILMAQRRTNVEDALKEITEYYHKGDDASLTVASVKLDELEALKTVYGLTTKNGDGVVKEWPFVFAHHEQAVEKRKLYQMDNPGVTYEVIKKDL